MEEKEEKEREMNVGQREEGGAQSLKKSRGAPRGHKYIIDKEQKDTGG